MRREAASLQNRVFAQTLISAKSRKKLHIFSGFYTLREQAKISVRLSLETLHKKNLVKREITNKYCSEIRSGSMF